MPWLVSTVARLADAHIAQSAKNNAFFLIVIVIASEHHSLGAKTAINHNGGPMAVIAGLFRKHCSCHVPHSATIIQKRLTKHKQDFHAIFVVTLSNIRAVYVIHKTNIPPENVVAHLISYRKMI